MSKGDNMATLDVSRAPRGVIAATALIHALENEDDRVERHYLELKGTLDLNSRRDAAKVAKFILGAANRPISLAETAFEGTAAMVVGVTNGKPVGVPPIEPMELARAVERYVGVAAVAPRWDVVRVGVPDSPNEVLIVLVEPPVEGQPMYLCLANGDGVADGAIYMRADGETRQATADEIKALLQRAAAGTVPQVELAVDIAYSPYSLTIDVDAAVADFVTAVRAHLFEAADEQPAPGIGLGAAVFAAAWLPEDRSREAYVAEISEWEIALREAVRLAPAELVGQLLPPVVVTVTNNSDAFLREVELNIHLEGEITGAGYDHAPALKNVSLTLPPLPRRWGPRPNPALALQLPSSLLSGMPSQPTFPTYKPSRTTWDNTGSVTISLDVGDLRPRGSVEVDEEEFVLWLPGGTENEAVTNGKWTITAVDHHRVFSGVVQLKPTKHADLTELLQELLTMRTPSLSNDR